MRIINEDARMVPIERIQPHPANPRKGDLKAIQASIQENGFYGVVVAQLSSGNILAGNHRYEAAVASGALEVPVIYVDVDDDRAKRILLADNRTSDLGEYDEKALLSLLQDLNLSSGSIAGTGYEDDNLGELLRKLGASEEEGAIANREDKISARKEAAAEAREELQKKWATETGQVWEFSSKTRPGTIHRLMVGDSVEDAGKLLKGVQPDGICTDPPYELECDLVARAIGNYGERVIMLIGDKQAFEFGKYWTFKLLLVWHHTTPRMGPNTKLPLIYHTLIPMYVKNPEVRLGFAKPENNFGSLIKFENPYYFSPKDESKVGTPGERAGCGPGGLHGQGKSAEVFERMMVGFDWKVVADPFAGSGGTMLACEAQGRQWYGMEKFPDKAACLLERAVEAGLEPILVPKGME